MRRILALVAVGAVGFSLGGHGPALLPAEAATVPAAAGFQFPESVYWDAPTASWYVTNFGGAFFNPGDWVADGFISKLGSDNAIPNAADLGLHREDSIVGVRLLRAHSVRFLGVEVASACLGGRCARPDPRRAGSDSLSPPSPKLARFR